MLQTGQAHLPNYQLDGVYDHQSRHRRSRTPGDTVLAAAGGTTNSNNRCPAVHRVCISLHIGVRSAEMLMMPFRATLAWLTWANYHQKTILSCSSARNPEHPEATTIYNLWLRSMASMCGRDGRTGRDRQEASQPASQPCSSCTPMRISLRNTYPGRSYRPALLVSFLHF